MPYNVPGETPIMTQKIENCVNDLMADPKFKPKNPKQDKKSAAIAVCKAAIMRSRGIQNKIIKKLNK